MQTEKEMNFYGKVYSEGCPGCNRVEPQGPALKIVLETEHLRVHQDYVLPIPGMMVIETKRHTAKLSDLTDEERFDLLKVWNLTSQATNSLGVENIQHVLEDRSSHFHLWLLPVYDWMRDATDGKLRNLQNVFEYAKLNLMTTEQIVNVEYATSKIFEYIENNK